MQARLAEKDTPVSSRTRESLEKAEEQVLAGLCVNMCASFFAILGMITVPERSSG